MKEITFASKGWEGGWEGGGGNLSCVLFKRERPSLSRTTLPLTLAHMTDEEQVDADSGTS